MIKIGWALKIKSRTMEVIISKKKPNYKNFRHGKFMSKIVKVLIIEL